MLKSNLLFTIGCSCSGKSTYCNEWAAAKPLRAIIAGDDFRYAMYKGVYNPWAEGLVFSSMDIAARALIKRGYRVMMDETSTTFQTILRYLRIDIDAEPVWIDTSTEICIERAIALNKPYMVEPIKRMSKQKEYLQKNFSWIFPTLKAEVISRKEQDVIV